MTGGGTGVAGAAGLEAAPVSGASLKAEFDFAAASEAAGAGDSSLLLLHAASTDAATRQVKRTDFFKVLSYLVNVESTIVPLCGRPHRHTFQVDRYPRLRSNSA